MNYDEVKEYLYAKLASFQRDGAIAFKKDLGRTISFLTHLNNPQDHFKAVHIAGTNGKGSSAHSIAAVLQSAGFKVGLYTSPHLVDFTERIRINGKAVGKQFIVDFVVSQRSFIEQLKPSFFETTVAMAFQYFAVQKVDIAVIETGMGGRLDSTNLVNPEVCLITNIGYDHQQFLGDTLLEIAGEKAGIIKPGVPVVISEKQPEVSMVFETVAHQSKSNISFATDLISIEKKGNRQDKQVVDVFKEEALFFADLELDMLGGYYLKNLPGILTTLDRLHKQAFSIPLSAYREGLSQVRELTGLKGRWQLLSVAPMVFCDVGHNLDGMKEVLLQIAMYQYKRLHIVYGTVNDKEIGPIIRLLPKDAKYYLCAPDMTRGLSTDLLAQEFELNRLDFTVHASVAKAIEMAKKVADQDDFIFIGGSTFVVAEIPEILNSISSKN